MMSRSKSVAAAASAVKTFRTKPPSMRLAEARHIAALAAPLHTLLGFRRDVRRLPSWREARESEKVE